MDRRQLPKPKRDVSVANHHLPSNPGGGSFKIVAGWASFNWTLELESPFRVLEPYDIEDLIVAVKLYLICRISKNISSKVRRHVHEKSRTYIFFYLCFR